MRTAYLWLARLLALLVVVQAMTIAFMTMGMTHWINQEGGAIDASVFKSWETNHPTWTGSIGYPLHALLIGPMVIPGVAVLLLIVSFFADVPKGVHLALALAVLVALQVGSAYAAENNPIFGLWHGLGAFLIFGAAMAAAMQAKKVPSGA